MKTISALLLLTGALSFSSPQQSTAIPQKIQGLDVYIMSEPTRPYEVLETNTKVFKMASCKDLINGPINKAAKVEGAQGVIIYFPQSSKYTIIKYVE